MDERWTDETVRLVAKALFTQDALDAMSGVSWEDLEDERYDWLRIAAAGLDALADAGLLVQPGSETRTEWGITWLAETDGTRRFSDFRDDEMDYDEDEGGEAAARSCVEWHQTHEAGNRGVRLASHTIHTGPWREVPDAS